ncbi:ATP-binding protein [Glaciecola petra]|uniref:ATP-binding protein n=1 Tax=Glaciecola petra TaxID=3075602 RepID=A0ABU2ZL58_9ALTE|nr:ATP-binding protein [Aestuariibacter sp. P117]MDT0593352.1 ATP-binding protein [Aestuariibacter sp. P117]
MSHKKITKVVFMGAPSTGKTTIAKKLAEHFSTQLVLEYGRTFWEQNQVDRLLSQEQLLHIAQEQIRQEEEALLKANEYLFVDTNALTTWHFAQDYYGCALPELDKLADESKARFDVVFLCCDDIPFEDTWERSGEVKRKEFQVFIENQLDKRGIKYHVLKGTVKQRMSKVLDVLKAVS